MPNSKVSRQMENRIKIAKVEPAAIASQSIIKCLRLARSTMMPANREIKMRGSQEKKLTKAKAVAEPVSDHAQRARANSLM